jgi:microcystin-dependent protein
MAEPFIGQIILAGFNFAPQGWAKCDGQLLPIAQNDALFNLIGTTYGGDGETTFALPDLRSRIPIGPGQGTGLQSYVLADAGGSENTTLTTNQLPAHNHVVTHTLKLTLRCKAGAGDSASPVNNLVAADSKGGSGFSNGLADSNMHPGAITSAGAVTAAITGGNQPHNNMQPFVGVNFCIALEGIFPNQS